MTILIELSTAIYNTFIKLMVKLLNYPSYLFYIIIYVLRMFNGRKLKGIYKVDDRILNRSWVKAYNTKLITLVG